MRGWGALAWLVLGPVLLLGLAPFLDGLGRRIRARLHSRKGPPLTQGWLDLAKLAGKREVRAQDDPLTRALPWAALTTAATAGLLLPVAGHAPLGFAGDGLVVLYLLGLSSAALALGGMTSGSPYGFLGASRELTLLLLVEPVVAGAFFVLALKAGTFRLDALVAWQAAHGPSVSAALAAAAVLVVLLAYLGKLPFDLSEAEQELTGGVLVEYGGRSLALWRWALFTRWLVVAWLAAEVFLPTPAPPLAGVPLALFKVLALFSAAAAAETLAARLRLDQARTVLTQVAFLIVFAITFALIGA
jgi:formate hydrogenlyase subunit 4